MLVLALADLAQLLRVADITAAMSVEALLGTDRAFAADLRRAAPAARPGRGAPRTCARCWPARRSSPATARATPASRTPTRCAAPRRSPARPATRSSTRERVAGAELRSAIDNPMVLPDGRVESCGNFHGAPLGYRLRLPRHRGRRGRRDRRAADRPAARRDPLARAARRSWPTNPGVNSGADDRPVHAGRDGGREPPSGRARRASTRCRRARCRRTTSRWAGARRASCAPWSANLAPDPRRRARRARRAGSTCARRCAPAPDTAAALAAVRAVIPGPGAGSLPAPRARRRRGARRLRRRSSRRCRAEIGALQ